MSVIMVSLYGYVISSDFNLITTDIDSVHEKILRESLKSAVDHALSPDTMIILDSLNYIKGYRYELYCIARSQRTPHCVVWVECEQELSNKWNTDNSRYLESMYVNFAY